MSPVQNRDRLHTQSEAPHPGPAETLEQEAAQDYAAVRVHVTNSVDVSPAAQFGAYQTIEIPAGGNALILPHDPLRDYAYIMGLDADLVLTTTLEPSQAAVNTGIVSGNAKVAYNATTAPAALAWLANFGGAGSLPPGYYNVTVQAYFATGTAPVDGTDSDNLFLSVDTVTTGGQLIIPATQNAVQTYTFQNVYTATGAIAVKAKNNATAGVIYRTTLVATPQASTGLGVAFPAGAYLPRAAWSPPVRHSEPVYAANVSPVANCRVVLLVERGRQE